MAVKRRKDTKKRVLKEGEYQRSNGTYEYKWRDKRGNRHSIYAKTLEELREKEIDVLRDALDGIQVDKNNLTINDLYHRWKQLKKGLQENTFQNYQYMYNQFVALDFGKSRISDLKKTDVRAFYNMLYETRGLQPSTIDSIHTVLHQVLELGVEDDILRYNPSDSALKELKKAHNKDGGEKKKKALTQDEQRLFEEYMKNTPKYHHWYPIFEVMLWTGLRVSEICGLRWCDVDFEKNTISINHNLIYYDKRSAKRCGFEIHEIPKTQSGVREIPMLPRVKEAFLQEKAYQKEAGISCKAVVDGYTDFIFVNRYGNVQQQGPLNKALKRIIRDCNYEVLDKAGANKDIVTLPNFTNHSLRHTFTTRMCEANVNIKAMQAILGHSDAETTLQIYAECTKELKTAEIISFEKYFERQKMKQINSI